MIWKWSKFWIIMLFFICFCSWYRISSPILWKNTCFYLKMFVKLDNFRNVKILSTASGFVTHKSLNNAIVMTYFISIRLCSEKQRAYEDFYKKLRKNIVLTQQNKENNKIKALTSKTHEYRGQFYDQHRIIKNSFYQHLFIVSLNLCDISTCV